MSALVLGAPPVNAQANDGAPDAPDWLVASYVITLDGFELTSIEADVDVHKMRSPGSGSDTAQDMRRQYQAAQGMSPEAAEEFVQNIEADLTDQVEMTLARAFPTGILGSVDVVVDRASLQGDSTSAYAPPVTFRLDAEVSRDLASVGLDGFTDEQILAVFDAGARLATEFSLFARPGHDNTFTIAPPEGLVFAEPDAGATVTAEGAIRLRVDGTAAAEAVERSVHAKIASPAAPAPAEDDASLRIVIDLKDLDVTVAKAAGGDFGALLVDIDVQGDLRVLSIPPELRANLPSGVVLDRITSDGIRLLVQRGVITSAEIDALEAALLETMAARLGAALGGDFEVTGGIDAASLDAPVSTPLSGDNPIVFRTGASVRKPLSGGPTEPQAQAATSLYTQALTFPMPKVEGFDTVYRVILPKGLAVLDATATGAVVTTGEDGGREYFEASPDEESAEVAVQIAVTPTFVWAKFWPVILGAVALLALVIGGPVVGFVALRRRRG